jgi:hypothetical protein
MYAAGIRRRRDAHARLSSAVMKLLKRIMRCG